MPSYSPMFRQRYDGNGYRKQKSCNQMITTLLLSIPITIKPLTQHPEIVDPGSVELLGQSKNISQMTFELYEDIFFSYGNVTILL